MGRESHEQWPRLKDADPAKAEGITKWARVCPRQWEAARDDAALPLKL